MPKPKQYESLLLRKYLLPPLVDRGTYIVHYDVLHHIFTVVQESNYF